MKNYVKVLVFASVLALIVVPAHALSVSDEMCALIAEMQRVFKILRVLAFVGAGFYMAGWAWEYITGGKGGDGGKGTEFSVADVKKKGVGLLVGFTLLFAIGLVISFLLSVQNEKGANCITSGWGAK